jgi:sugar phosphate isomerase/epimerase
MTTPGTEISRRTALTRTGLAVGAALAGSSRAVAADAAPTPTPMNGHEFILCLNTATLRGFKMSLIEEIELAAKVGYTAVEPWMDKIHGHAKDGGSLKELGQRIRDLGLTVESAIGFSEWIVEDEARRAKGMEQAKLDLDAVAQIGGKRLACPPAGAKTEPIIDLHKVVERYRAVLELGDQFGVVPEMELWAHSANIRHLSDAMFVVLESHHPKACVLADIFHLYKGGSGFDGLHLLSAEAHPVVHMNDYPADPGPDEISDAFRVFPGDGVAPLPQILRSLRVGGGRTVLSLELFNHEYWKRDRLWVAQTGLEKMKAAIASAA